MVTPGFENMKKGNNLPEVDFWNISQAYVNKKCLKKSFN